MNIKLHSKVHNSKQDVNKMYAVIQLLDHRQEKELSYLDFIMSALFSLIVLTFLIH